MHAMNITILFNQLLDSRSHHQAKVRIAFCLFSNKLEEVCLGNQGNIGKAGFQTPKVGERDHPFSRLQGQHIGFGMIKLKQAIDRKSTRLNSSHQIISYAVFCLKKKKIRFSMHMKSQLYSSHYGLSCVIGSV